MKIIAAKRTNYSTLFQGDETDVRTLARWMHRCVNDVEKSRQSTASALWKGWLDETFVGFSATDKIMLYSGHRAALSREIAPGEARAGGIKAILRQLRKLFFGREQESSLEKMLPVYRKFFPDFRIPGEEQHLANMMPSQYLHACETFELLKEKVPDLCPASMFEIGAGAGVHVALLATRGNGKLKDIVICDLPQSIFAGYLFLRTALPDYSLRLPDVLYESTDPEAASVQFVTPEQLPELRPDRFEFALNTQSFQEMDLQVVNNYLREVVRLLQPGGLMVSKNSRVSRHITGNSLDRYDFTGFSQKILESPTPFTNQLNPFDCVMTCFRA